MTYIGIDNGISGAIAFVDDTVFEPLVIKMPVIKTGKYTVIDVRALWQFLSMPLDGGAHVIFEQGNINPLFGAKGNFSTGDSFASVRTVLTLAQVPHTLVTAKTWQKDMLQDVRGAAQDTKAAAIEVCRRLFPDVSLVPPGCKKPHSGFADALCMAAWGKRKRL